ncbi:DUF6693 family protein [Marinagarivorans algicola]|uniref:DUF6693 family protein n=1 Tax=Marinagarivorans algicola TaxID=1513270 RepID=UPI0037358C34
MKIQANLGTVNILVHIVIWFILVIITFGIAAFFFPYSFSKFILDCSELIDEQGQSRKIVCNTDMFGNIGHVIIWIIITIITFGIGYAFYFYKVWNYSLNNTTIERFAGTGTRFKRFAGTGTRFKSFWLLARYFYNGSVFGMPVLESTRKGCHAALSHARLLENLDIRIEVQRYMDFFRLI